MPHASVSDVCRVSHNNHPMDYSAKALMPACKPLLPAASTNIVKHVAAGQCNGHMYSCTSCIRNQVQRHHADHVNAAVYVSVAYNVRKCRKWCQQQQPGGNFPPGQQEPPRSWWKRCLAAGLMRALQAMLQVMVQIDKGPLTGLVAALRRRRELLSCSCKHLSVFAAAVLYLLHHSPELQLLQKPHVFVAQTTSLNVACLNP